MFNAQQLQIENSDLRNLIRQYSEMIDEKDAQIRQLNQYKKRYEVLRDKMAIDDGYADYLVQKRTAALLK